MKYVYVKAKNKLEVARHEVVEENKYSFSINPNSKIKGDDIWINRQLNNFSPPLSEHFSIISYREYRAIVNGKIQAQREILDQEYSRYQKAYYEAKKELKAKELPMDEVTE